MDYCVKNTNPSCTYCTYTAKVTFVPSSPRALIFRTPRFRPRSQVPVFDRPGADRTGECTTWNLTSPVLTGQSKDKERCDEAVVHA
jgi:hypothetical protein